MGSLTREIVGLMSRVCVYVMPPYCSSSLQSSVVTVGASSSTSADD